MTVTDPTEKPIYDAFLKHRTFIEKFQGGGERYVLDDYYEGHSFSFIEDKFDNASIECVRRFKNIANQTFIYIADGPVRYWDFTDADNPDKVGTETVCLTANSLNIHRETSEIIEINIPWSEISSIEGSWVVYKKENGKRVEIASFEDSTLVGGSNSTNLKKWRAVFSDVLSAAKNVAQSTSKSVSVSYMEGLTKGQSQNSKQITTNHMNIDKSKIDYVIGIDLGHGETSAALCPIQWDRSVGQLDPVKDLELGGNKKVIPSAITILENGNAYIGDSAFSPDVLKNAQVNVCFKKRPEKIDGEKEKLMIRFMAEVYKRIRENNAAILTDTNHLVYIATPSGWDKVSQNLYVEMAKKAGLPIAGVTKESRAAFVRAQHDATSGLGRNIEKGAVVFDMGSSTLDFTYMNKNLPNLVDNGYDCGASLVEKTIYKNQEEKSEAIKMFEERFPKLIDYLVFEARKVKEQVYFDPTLKVKKTINFDDFIEDEELEDERFKLLFNPGELDKMLEECGYIKSIEDAMLDYKAKFIPDQKIFGVFLTGGASRMDFIKSLVCKCWGVEESQVYRDNDPSLTISQGVAEVARMDLRTDGMDTGLDEAFEKLENGDQIYDTFIQEYGYYIWDKITDGVIDVINYFGDADENYSLNDLQNGISDAVKEIIENESAASSEFMDRAISENLSDIQAKVEDIISNYSSQGINVNLKDFDFKAPKVSDINLDGVMSEISDKIVEESTEWGGVIAGAAIGGVIGFLFPIIGILGGAAILAKKIFFGETEEEKQAKAMARELNKEERGEVFNSLKDNWEDMSNSIQQSINNALTSDKKIKKSIKQAVRELLSAYKENLESARLLID